MMAEWRNVTKWQERCPQQDTESSDLEQSTEQRERREKSQVLKLSEPAFRYVLPTAGPPLKPTPIVPAQMGNIVSKHHE